ncbi:hypothetical protein QTG54_014566 [Skeletonema marinoi]|uniref:Uncharacterized protein n=1 Tax=Skeletonema marinoi TaxID=267567 RepID=A0AAD8XVZ7_9STRA|nr:hypothetical protein QTG54_014566 [Skeletonema marinoi]
MNLDLEQSAPLRRRGPRPEGNDDAMPMIPPPPPGLPPRHPLQLMKRTAIMGGTLYAMHELYQGKKNKKKVEYENFRAATHASIVLILIAWISFHKSLSPLYGGFKTMLIMIGFGFGVLLQAALMIPVWGQNFLSFVILTFFLQQYK